MGVFRNDWMGELLRIFGRDGKRGGLKWRVRDLETGALVDVEYADPKGKSPRLDIHKKGGGVGGGGPIDCEDKLSGRSS